MSSHGIDPVPDARGLVCRSSFVSMLKCKSLASWDSHPTVTINALARNQVVSEFLALIGIGAKGLSVVSDELKSVRIWNCDVQMPSTKRLAFGSAG